MIRPFRQPSAVECVPACVYAVVRSLYGEQAFSYEQIREACSLDSQGSVHLIALEGLQALLDIETLPEPTLAGIAVELLHHANPVVLFSRGPAGHAVVACELSASGLRIMDPERGDFTTISPANLLPFEAAIYDVWVIRA